MPLGLQRGTQRIYMEPAIAGQTIEEVRVVNAFNANQGTAQVDTITLTTVANNDAFTIAKPGFPTISLTLNATTGASVGAARNALLAALLADYQWYTRFDIVASSTAAILLIDRQVNVVTSVAVFTATTGTPAATVAISTAASAAVATPYGLVVARKSAHNYIDGVLTVAVPSDAGDVLQGVVIASHVPPTVGFDHTANSNPVNRAFDVLKQGIIWAVTETAIAPEDTTLFYRHTANGALNRLGAIAPASGTGLAALTGAVSKGASQTLDNGTMITPIYVDFA